MKRVFALLLALVLAATVYADVTTFIGVSGFLTTDWCPTSGTGCIALWKMEEAANTTRYATGGSCGSNCDLTDYIPNVGKNTTAGQFVEGTASADFVGAAGTLLCEPGTCTTLGFSGDITFGCWVRETQDLVTVEEIWKINTIAFTGFRMRRRYNFDDLLCTIGDGTALRSTDTADGSWAVNTMYHMVCTHDGSSTTTAYINGAYGNSTSVGSAMATDTSASFKVGNGYNTGQEDECFVYDADFTAAQVCRECSCGLRGELCMCDAADNTAYKTCTTDADCQVLGNTTALCNTYGGTSRCVGKNATETPNCGSCTLPSCNAGAPT
jgi:hypothetical protein